MSLSRRRNANTPPSSPRSLTRPGAASVPAISFGTACGSLGSSALAGGSGDEGGHDVGGVPVEAAPGPVVAHRGSRVGVTGCFLDVEKDRPHRPVTDVEVECPAGAWCDGDGDVLGAFAHDCEGSVAAFGRQVLDVGVERFGDSQPVERQQGKVMRAPSRRSPRPAWTSRALSSLRSRPRVRDSQSTLGRRMLAAGFFVMVSSIWQYL